MTAVPNGAMGIPGSLNRIGGVLINVNPILRIGASGLLFPCGLDTNPALLQASSADQYPNERPAFRLFQRHLSPLRSGLSNQGAVRRVLGDPATVKREEWIITPTYNTTGGPVLPSGARRVGTNRC